MDISERGSALGAAGVMAGACKQDINEVHVCFFNCYEKNLVNITCYLGFIINSI